MEKTIYLAGGCFWGLQKVMKEICGVTATVCGYANGTGEAEADYETVCGGKTGFRETVQVNYDPKKVSLEKLLFAFFYVIDPQAVGRQGNRCGNPVSERYLLGTGGPGGPKVCSCCRRDHEAQIS